MRAEGKSPTTRSFAWLLAGLAKRMNLTDVAGAFSVAWHTVYESVKMAVDWGLKNRDLSNIRAIAIDEIAWQKGHNWWCWI